ncbi:MAG: hypothetical protein KAI99_11445, partial [Cyclobacteriaceae bacterium]|nr:hypothetical protein [Cyclobacteriaceae bacterium]
MSKNGLYILILIIFCSCGFEHKVGNKSTSIFIDLWYGDNQEFGNVGLPQRWINILGNVKSDSEIASLTYSLNGESPKLLRLGSDLHRLAQSGDFNIDIDIKLLREGENDLIITARDSANRKAVKDVKIHFNSSKKWPLPYSIDWSKVKQIQDVVQVVDGNWKITEKGLHNIDTYYDRVVAFGDSTWRDYEVWTTVTFHAFTAPAKGPPTYNVSHAAIASRWPGHDTDEFQPHRKWYPLGATSEFRLTAGLDSCRWRIFDGPKPNAARFHVEQTYDKYRKIKLDKKYGMKHRVETVDINTTKYSVKLWPADEEEPEQWDFIGTEKDENIRAGSVL